MRPLSGLIIGIIVFICFFYDTYSLRIKRSLSDQDSICIKDIEDIKSKILSANRFFSEFTFKNLSDSRIAFTWAGQNTNRILLISESAHSELDDFYRLIGFTIANPSTVFFSTDGGLSFFNFTSNLTKQTQLTDRLYPMYLRNDIGLMRNPNNPAHLLLVGYQSISGSHNSPLFSPSGSEIWMTLDGGFSWHQKLSDFTFQNGEQFEFSKKNGHYVLARSISDELLVSTDGGLTWARKDDHVAVAKWAPYKSSSSILYLKYDNTRSAADESGAGKCCFLYHSIDNGDNKQLVADHIYNFGVYDYYVYYSYRPKENDPARLLRSSKDGGENWTEVYLPIITPERFYSVLGTDEGLVFIHVDDEGDTGYGTLFTSDGSGSIFSESLPRHFYPNFLHIHDFYRVQSMRGVYLATQMIDEHEHPERRNSLRSVISYNKGVTWQDVPKPDSEQCKEDSPSHLTCSLQIYGQYSQFNSILGMLPMSTPSAPGLIIVHGHVDYALQTDEPDVYISNDGGYHFRKALTGPHFIEITNHGNVIAAVPMHGEKNTIFFSFDDGYCWHSHKFSNATDFQPTGLVTEPGNKARSMALWGFRGGIPPAPRVWTSYVFNFQLLLGETCKPSDLEDWMPHAQAGAQSGCVLGQKETLKRIKSDSQCFLEYDFDRTILNETCPCTEDDFECEFGFYRPKADGDCIEMPIFSGSVELCKKGKIEELIDIAYRRIPGDSCQGGMQDELKQKANGKRDRIIDHCDRLVGSANRGGLIDNPTTTTLSYEEIVIQQDTMQNMVTFIAIILCAGFLVLMTIGLLLYRISQRRRLMTFRRGNFAYSTLANQDGEAAERLMPSQRVHVAEQLEDEAAGLPFRTSKDRKVNRSHPAQPTQLQVNADDDDESILSNDEDLAHLIPQQQIASSNGSSTFMPHVQILGAGGAARTVPAPEDKANSTPGGRALQGNGSFGHTASRPGSAKVSGADAKHDSEDEAMIE